jgi:hypothetical protein
MKSGREQTPMLRDNAVASAVNVRGSSPAMSNRSPSPEPDAVGNTGPPPSSAGASSRFVSIKLAVRKDGQLASCTVDTAGQTASNDGSNKDSSSSRPVTALANESSGSSLMRSSRNDVPQRVPNASMISTKSQRNLLSGIGGNGVSTKYNPSNTAGKSAPNRVGSNNNSRYPTPTRPGTANDIITSSGATDHEGALPARPHTQHTFAAAALAVMTANSRVKKDDNSRGGGGMALKRQASTLSALSPAPTPTPTAFHRGDSDNAAAKSTKATGPVYGDVYHARTIRSAANISKHNPFTNGTIQRQQQALDFDNITDLLSGEMDGTKKTSYYEGDSFGSINKRIRQVKSLHVREAYDVPVPAELLKQSSQQSSKSYLSTDDDASYSNANNEDRNAAGRFSTKDPSLASMSPKSTAGKSLKQPNLDYKNLFDFYDLGVLNRVEVTDDDEEDEFDAYDDKSKPISSYARDKASVKGQSPVGASYCSSSHHHVSFAQSKTTAGTSAAADAHGGSTTKPGYHVDSAAISAVVAEATTSTVAAKLPSSSIEVSITQHTAKYNGRTLSPARSLDEDVNMQVSSALVPSAIAKYFTIVCSCCLVEPHFEERKRTADGITSETCGIPLFSQEYYVCTCVPATLRMTLMLFMYVGRSQFSRTPGAYNRQNLILSKR